MIDNIEFEDIYLSDAPDFVDAFISSADLDGVPMDETQLNDLNEDRDFVYEQVIKYLY